MKPVRKVAKQLARKDGPYSIRVKVIEKESVYISLEKPTLDYQLITFQDEEGAKLKTILYNEELEMFGDVLEDQMNYEIYNPKVRIITVPSCTCANDQFYQLTLTNQSAIHPIWGQASETQPKYILMASIPRSMSLDDRYDVLGIVIYVDLNCKVPRSNGQHSEVCEIVIIDQSSEQIMIVTAWKEITTEQCMNLLAISETFPVVAFTCLRTSYRKGFSLSTTHATFINLDPRGEEATALRTWSQANQELLAAKHQNIFEVRHPPTHRNIITVENLLQKTVRDTLQEEQHWLYVQLTEFDCQKIRLYLGCSNCNTGNGEDLGVVYACITCFKENVISSPRMAVTFEAKDESGTSFFTALNEAAETLLEVDVVTLYRMLPQEKEDYLCKIEHRIRSTPMYIQVAASSALYRCGQLSWVLQKISAT